MRWLLSLAILLSGEAFAQKIEARLDCKYTGKDFIYDCALQISRAGTAGHGTGRSHRRGHAVDAHGAQREAGEGAADEDARASTGARLDLEMTGEWAVKLRLAGPVRDQLVLHYEFDERGARPVRRSAKSPRK